MHEREADGGYVSAPFHLEDVTRFIARPHGCDRTHEEAFERWCQVCPDVRGRLLVLRGNLFFEKEDRDGHQAKRVQDVL